MELKDQEESVFNANPYPNNTNAYLNTYNEEQLMILNGLGFGSASEDLAHLIWNSRDFRQNTFLFFIILIVKKMCHFLIKTMIYSTKQNKKNKSWNFQELSSSFSRNGGGE